MGDERSFEKQATAALRRRVELRGLKDSAKAARPCREPLSKRSRAPCVVSSSAASDDEEQEEEEEEEEEEGDYNGDEDANPEADLEDVTRSFHIFPRDESKADCDSESKLVYQSSVPSSPSQFLLEDMDTLSVDSSLVSYNSEEENALGMGLDSDLARERSTVSFASDSSSLCAGNNSASDDTPTPTDTSTANVSDLEIIGLEGSQSATISRETVAEDSISEPSFPVALQAQSVSEKVSSVGGAARDAIFLSSSQGPCISASQRISSFIHSIKTPPWAYISIAGRRPEMEDAVAAVPGFYSLPSKSLQGCPLNLTDAEKIHEGCAMHFFGVYDGHGGAQASNYCKVRLHQALAEELETAFGEASKENMSTEEWKHKWERALVDSFKKVDAEVGQEPSRREDGEEDSGLECCTEPVAPETVGTTAVVAVVGACHVIVANCGDSRAVLCRAGRAIPLSEDHKPQREDETARIEAAGGKVICWNGYRVLGVLAMSRAIGDRYLKPCIIPDPEITFTQRMKEDDCLILATDGLWDVISNEEACDIARKRIARWHNTDQSSSSCKVAEPSMDLASQAAATHLCKLALQRGSSDNITVLVVDLKAKRRKGLRHNNN